MVVKEVMKRACLAFLCVSYEEVYGTYLWRKPLIRGSGPHCSCPRSRLSMDWLFRGDFIFGNRSSSLPSPDGNAQPDDNYIDEDSLN